MNDPVLPLSAKQPIEVHSPTHPGWSYVLQPATNRIRTLRNIHARAARGRMDPLRAQMRAIITGFDYTEHLTAWECQRLKNIAEYLEQGNFRLDDTDRELYGLAESICLENSTSFIRLAVEEEEISLDNTLRNVAIQLKTATRGDESYTWEDDEFGHERYAFLAEIAEADPDEWDFIKIQTANLLRPTPETEKNLGPPSGSGSTPDISPGDDTPPMVATGNSTLMTEETEPFSG